MELKKLVWRLLDVTDDDDRFGRAFDYFLIGLIFLNVLAFILESVEPIYRDHGRLFEGFEVFSVVVFTIEYIGRLWSCTHLPQYSSTGKGHLRFMREPLNVIDVLAILPFYLPFLGVDLRFMRTLRLLRILRIAKLGRYFTALSLMGRVFVQKREELILTSVIMGILLIVASSGIYYFEFGAQPEAFPSIPAAMWWAVTTMTTVGYGDVAPVTGWGKLFAAFVQITSIGLFALPTGILGAGFVAEIEAQKGAKERICPHCGKAID